MSKNYNEMWKNLGLDLKAHEVLLNTLSEFYKNIYLSQKNRPEGMKYFDFVISEAHGLRIEELINAKKENRKVIGAFCVYVPEEIILALDGICVGLCAGAQIGFDEAEKYIHKNSCALIKAFLGFELTSVCPYIKCCDLLVGETTCDGKKKAYEALNEITGKVYVMEVPNTKSDEAKNLYLKEVEKFKNLMEKLAQKEITLETLKQGIKISNEKRKALLRLEKLRAANPSPISGLDALLVQQIAFYDDPIRFTQKVNELCDELEERIKKGVGVFPETTPRILISGCPFALPNWKLHHIVETCGAVIVGEESCVGKRYYYQMVDENFSSIEEGLKKIAERYLATHCACFTPNDERIEDIKEMYKSQKADGVIHYSLQFCTPYMFESYKIERKVDFPYLKIETDYSMEDLAQLRNRIEAFIETLR
jgi:benzoyl-CoA reductase/2-hydroxyglutaryl-CoA dehydratase subunit BcrC/BadD/HgdB